MKCPPLSFNAFAKLVRPRLLPREGIAGLSADDQQQLVRLQHNNISLLFLCNRYRVLNCTCNFVCSLDEKQFCPPLPLSSIKLL